MLVIPSTNVAEEGQLKLGAMPALHIFRLPEFYIYHTIKTLKLQTNVFRCFCRSKWSRQMLFEAVQLTPLSKMHLLVIHSACLTMR